LLLGVVEGFDERGVVALERGVAACAPEIFILVGESLLHDDPLASSHLLWFEKFYVQLV
jgi:hypothetical protein